MTALLSTPSPHQSPCHHVTVSVSWAIQSEPSAGWSIGNLPAPQTYLAFCIVLPINISQMHLSLPAMLLYTYLGSYHLMSQLLQHPFSWSLTNSVLPWWCIDPQCCCRDHSVASHFLFAHLPSSFSLSYQSPGLHFQGPLHLIAHFIRHQNVSLHTWTVHSPCFQSSLDSFAIRCLRSVSWDSAHLWESIWRTVILFCCSPWTSFQKYLLVKKCLASSYAAGGLKCLWYPLLRLMLHERRCHNIRNFQKYHTKFPKQPGTGWDMLTHNI